MDELTQLAIKYGTDKWGKHHYTPVYYELFKDRRNEVNKVVEIGVGEGAGLRMWRDFFPNALIYGIDNQDSRIFEDVPIAVFKADQSIRAELLDAWDQIVPGPQDVDLVVDDGSHDPEDQISTCLTIMPLLDRDATYVIEDVAYPSIVDKLTEFYDCEVLKVGERYDDRLILVRYKQ